VFAVAHAGRVHRQGEGEDDTAGAPDPHPGGRAFENRGERMSNSNWKVFELAEELSKHAKTNAPYHEFLRVPSLSCGTYTLAAGATDLQNPHDEDEVYYVVSGRARLRVGDDEQTVGPGSLLYIGATSEHSFFEIEEDMTLLVFFASGGPAD
jgi:mannose-6-phosphate isomerase-like protein (cupin superfamily)